MIIQVLFLIFCYAVAIGLALRIYLYHKTGDPKYKHKYNCWMQTGKHLKKKGSNVDVF